MRYIFIIFILTLSSSCFNNNEHQKRTQNIIREVLKRIVEISDLDLKGNSLVVTNRPISKIIRIGLDGYSQGREKDSLVSYFIPQYIEEYKEDLKFDFLKEEMLFDSVQLFLNPNTETFKKNNNVNVKAAITIPYIKETEDYMFLCVHVEGGRNCPTIGYFLVYKKIGGGEVALTRSQLLYSSDLKASLENLY